VLKPDAAHPLYGSFPFAQSCAFFTQRMINLWLGLATATFFNKASSEIEPQMCLNIHIFSNNG